mgnify:CR=1 FL=1
MNLEGELVDGGEEERVVGHRVGVQRVLAALAVELDGGDQPAVVVTEADKTLLETTRDLLEGLDPDRSDVALLLDELKGAAKAIGNDELFLKLKTGAADGCAPRARLGTARVREDARAAPPAHAARRGAARAVGAQADAPPVDRAACRAGSL